MLGTVAELGNPLLSFGVFVTDKHRTVAAPALASAAFFDAAATVVSYAVVV